MVLLDHFRPPLNARRHWHSFHNAWATYIAADLNQSLPEGYFAEPNVQFGIEIDVATFNEANETVIPLSVGGRRDWSPSAPDRTIPFQPASESVEISIFSNEAGPTLAGAIELVSPANKDRPEHRQAFIAKCEIGKELPMLPLWLPGGLCLPVKLNATYARTCQEQRISIIGAE